MLTFRIANHQNRSGDITRTDAGGVMDDWYRKSESSVTAFAVNRRHMRIMKTHVLMHITTPTNIQSAHCNRRGD